MAVYTEVSDDELANFIASYEVGALLSYKGIAEGVENTNYLVHTEKGPFFLTLYEKRVEPRDLPFFLGLMEHLAEPASPAPHPCTTPRARAAHAGRQARCARHVSGGRVDTAATDAPLRGAWAGDGAHCI
jgi:homoserine kinase type II